MFLPIFWEYLILILAGGSAPRTPRWAVRPLRLLKVGPLSIFKDILWIFLKYLRIFLEMKGYFLEKIIKTIKILNIFYFRWYFFYPPPWEGCHNEFFKPILASFEVKSKSRIKICILGSPWEVLGNDFWGSQRQIRMRKSTF